MFASLNNRLGDILGKLRRKGRLTGEDIDAALREVRVALLEADVALPVVKEFVAGLREKALGAEIVKSVSPAQMVVKLVHDRLTELLGSENAELNIAAAPPAVIMMVGLQGSGKTTTSGKLALRLKKKHGKKVLLASLDVYRPAAQKQLAVVGDQAGVASLPIVEGEKPAAIAGRALLAGREEGYDVVILDTAGRLHIDGALMRELQEVKAIAQPLETLLVADALTGQDAVSIAREFHEQVGVTGIVLTRVDGDARGGAALSMRQVTGQPVKFMGLGEKLEEFEPFHPERIASRILDMGDVVSLVERAAENIDREEAEKMAVKLQQGRFDFNDLLAQFRQLKKMGGLSSLMGLIPGIGKIKEQMKNANFDENALKKQEAIILSMTPQERANPKLMSGSRKRRIAAGAGTTVQEVNKLLKAQQQMEGMMKKMRKAGGGKGMRAMMRGIDPAMLPTQRR